MLSYFTRKEREFIRFNYCKKYKTKEIVANVFIENTNNNRAYLNILQKMKKENTYILMLEGNYLESVVDQTFSYDQNTNTCSFKMTGDIPFSQLERLNSHNDLDSFDFRNMNGLSREKESFGFGTLNIRESGFN